MKVGLPTERVRECLVLNVVNKFSVIWRRESPWNACNVPWPSLLWPLTDGKYKTQRGDIVLIRTNQSLHLLLNGNRGSRTFLFDQRSQVLPCPGWSLHLLLHVAFSHNHSLIPRSEPPTLYKRSYRSRPHVATYNFSCKWRCLVTLYSRERLWRKKEREIWLTNSEKMSPDFEVDALNIHKTSKYATTKVVTYIL